ncbi:MAG: class I SAM-dependent methyltransferase [Deinococcales bacterium]
MKQPATDAIERYRALLERYHRTLDLLSDRGLAELDRLLGEAERYVAVVRRVAPEARTVLDVGSGAGLPGIVLAVRLPQCRVVLAERRRKRASFLTLVSGQLGLRNVEVAKGDVARLQGLRADVVVAQAVGTLAEVVRLTRGVASPSAVFLSRKGPDWREELRTLRDEVGTAVAVVAEEPLEHRGTLVALRFAGGPACPSSA